MPNEIEIKDFLKLDLRVGKIVQAERVKNTTKLLKLIVDIGTLGKRQLVAGIAEKYTPDELLNKNIIVLTNLKPAVIRGIKSEGMILAAATENDKEIALLQPDKEINLGAKVK